MKKESFFLISTLMVRLAVPAVIFSENMSYADLRALSQNRRIIEMDMEYRAIERVDTGRSIEPMLDFRDSSGIHYYIRMPAAGREFRPFHHYRIEFRLTGFARTGRPIGEFSPDSSIQMSAPEKYEGDIRDSDPRAAEILDALRSGRTLSDGYRLRYSGVRGDFLSFYDLDGREIYYRYREDRFDDRGDARMRDLISGEAYVVHGQFQGMLVEGKLTASTDPEFRKILENPEAVPVFLFQSAESLRLEQIIF